MNEDKQKPRLTGEGARRAEMRQDRLAKALRDNLVKRKAQQRAREAGPAAAPDPSAPRGSAADGDAEG